MNYLEQLDNGQIAAVTGGDGIVKVIAGPGSGKTRIITHRIAYLLTEKKAAPGAVLAMTYTRKATQTMQARLNKLSGAAAGEVEVKTIHSLCLKIAREEGLIPNYRVLSDYEANSIFKDILNEQKPGIDLENARQSIRGMKNCLITAEEARVLNPEVARIYTAYERKKRQANGIDYEDMLLTVFNLFSTRHTAREKYAERYQYILIDEAQDISKAQFEIIKLLIAPHYNLFVVCDPNQAIYGWRGANGSIARLQNDYPEMKEFALTTNYRHGENIIRASNNLIRHNYDALSIQPVPAPGTVPGQVLVIEAKTPEQEAYTTAKQIMRLKREGARLKDCAILVRANRQIPIYARACAEVGIPCDCRANQKPASSFQEKSLLKTIMDSIYKMFKSETLSASRGNSPKASQKDRLNILTMHKAKGLEFDHVFVGGLTEGTFPDTRKDPDIEEERRICYVAMTRAKKSLYLGTATPSSRFAYEAFSA